MAKLLFVNACVRSESRTKQIADRVIEIEGGDVSELVVQNEGMLPLDERRLSFRQKMLDIGDITDEMFKYAKQFAMADEIVIAAPYWELQFPAILKTYLENIAVTGITFKYGENGIPEGLCKAKKLIYVTTAGGYIGDFNFGYDYIRTLMQGMFGIEDVRFISAEGLDIEGNNVEDIMNDAFLRAEEVLK